MDAEAKLDKYAVHEAGHITAAMALGTPCVFSWISVRAHVGGVAATGITNPQTQRERIAEIVLLCAGRAAELLPRSDEFFAATARVEPTAAPCDSNAQESVSSAAAWLGAASNLSARDVIKSDRAQVEEMVAIMRHDHQTQKDQFYWWNRGQTMADQILRNNRTLFRKVANALRRDRILLGRQLSEMAALVNKVF